MVRTATPQATEPPPVVEAPAPRRTLSSLARPLAVPLLAYGASRLITMLAVALSALAGRHSLHYVFTVWDGRWYERIARSGYPTSVPEGDFYAGTGRPVQSEIAFFPLYPVLVRALDTVLPGGADVAGVVLSFITGAVATVLVWLIADRLAGRTVADRAAVLFAFSPGAFVLSLVYAEGLLVVFSAACLLALLDRRWVAAGVLAALATATRPNGTAVIMACAWAAGVAIWQRREWRAVTAPLLAPAGMLAFFAYLWWHTGETLIWFRVQYQGWGERIDFGLQNAKLIPDFLTHPFQNPNKVVLIGSMLLSAVLIVVLLRARLPGVLNVHALGGLAVVLASHINARPRFIFVAFPLVIALAKTIRRPPVFTVVASLFAASTVMLTVFYGLHRANYYP
ncbi:MAG TPA: glycosyltransferase family 39 protein [Acidimicrobiia bacterium]|nr:glycosyltransferase family 39 protein [Acidimicrobiia bacterium]